MIEVGPAGARCAAGLAPVRRLARCRSTHGRREAAPVCPAAFRRSDLTHRVEASASEPLQKCRKRIRRCQNRGWVTKTRRRHAVARPVHTDGHKRTLGLTQFLAPVAQPRELPLIAASPERRVQMEGSRTREIMVWWSAAAVRTGSAARAGSCSKNSTDRLSSPPVDHYVFAEWRVNNVKSEMN